LGRPLPGQRQLLVPLLRVPQERQPPRTNHYAEAARHDAQACVDRDIPINRKRCNCGDRISLSEGRGTPQPARDLRDVVMSGLRGVANAGPANLACNPIRWLFELPQQTSQQQESCIPAVCCKPDNLVPPDRLGVGMHAALKQTCGWRQWCRHPWLSMVCSEHFALAEQRFATKKGPHSGVVFFLGQPLS